VDLGSDLVEIADGGRRRQRLVSELELRLLRGSERLAIRVTPEEDLPGAA
jgi:hypothetical protein